MQVHHRYTREELLNLRDNISPTWLRIDVDIPMGKNQLQVTWFDRLMKLLAEKEFIDAYILCDTRYRNQFSGRPIEKQLDIRKFLEIIIDAYRKMDKCYTYESIHIEDAIEQLNIILR